VDGIVAIFVDEDRTDACIRARRLAAGMSGEEALMRVMARAAKVGDTPLVIALGLIIAGEDPTPERIAYLMR
jgi:hypothetical protein